MTFGGRAGASCVCLRDAARGAACPTGVGSRAIPRLPSGPGRSRAVLGGPERSQATAAPPPPPPPNGGGGGGGGGPHPPRTNQGGDWVGGAPDKQDSPPEQLSLREISRSMTQIFGGTLQASSDAMAAYAVSVGPSVAMDDRGSLIEASEVVCLGEVTGWAS
jgi:hypothetical protein